MCSDMHDLHLPSPHITKEVKYGRSNGTRFNSKKIVDETIKNPIAPPPDLTKSSNTPEKIMNTQLNHITRMIL